MLTQINEYITDKTGELKENSEDIDFVLKISSKLNDASEIRSSIQTSNLEEGIMKYITPYFQMDKNDVFDENEEIKFLEKE